MSAARCYAVMPGPKPLPIIGNSWRFALGVKPWRTTALDVTLWTLRALAGENGAAKVAKLFGHPDLVFPFCAEETARIYRREDAMPHRAVAPCLKHYKQELRKDFFGDEPGLIGVHGEPWSRFRSKVSKAIAAPEAARATVPDLDSVAEDFVKRMENIVDGNRELPEQFLTEIYKWALESVGAWALGTRLGCLSDDDAEAKEIIRCIHGFFHSVPTLELSAPMWRLYSTEAYKIYVKALDAFRSLCLRRLTDKGICASISKQSGEKVAAILALDLMLVGVDTTAAAAASTMYLLANNERAQDKLQRELDSNLPLHRTLTSKDLDKLPYLRACIKESLRIKPVILGNGRCIQSDTVISGYEVPKGSHVVFPHYILSNEERYFPSPEAYVPERWLRDENAVKEEGCPMNRIGDSTEHATGCNDHKRALAVWRKQKEVGIHPFASLPFGFGRRMCIGKRFAEAELQLLLAKTFQRYNVSWRYGELTYSVTPTYVPNEPLRFTIQPRNN
ncbi:probable cytochrome P450 49a1 [Amyelois transitella]|uniref:probable cytochrome P450 49a1 n=1 Tax=Amyelois transitella TaxID=680683 RepID=UPI00298F5613|nr:probable cytochrome P450 49a1 [Amyelois transitella]